MLPVFIFLLSFSSIVLSQFNTFQKLDLPSTSAGPEAIAFDPMGRGPYTGVSDGKIVRYDGPNNGFVDFAFTSPNRYVMMISVFPLYINELIIFPKKSLAAFPFFEMKHGGVSYI